MAQATAIAAARPMPVEWLALAAAAAAKAAASILPSRPMSITPERSQIRPARAQSSSGVVTRRVEASIEPIRISSMRQLLRNALVLARQPTMQLHKHRQAHRRHGAGKQHDQAL